MIRPATANDIPDMIRMAAQFFDVSGLGRWFRFKPQDFAQTAAFFIENSKTEVLVGEGPTGVTGMAGAMSYPCWFDNAHLTAQEWLWWVDPSCRGGPAGAALRNGLEDWARGRGCSTMEMGALEASRPEIMTRLYKRKGYEPKERIFCKRLVA